MVHMKTEHSMCSTPGHEDKPEHGRTGLCQACYRRAKRQERGLKAPGPKPDPTKPYSRHGGSLSHHGPRPACASGHEFVDGSYKVRTDGKRICLVCVEEKRPEACPAGHEYTKDNQYIDNRGWVHCRSCVLQKKPVRDRIYKYHLTPEKFEALLEAQEYLCGSCKDPLDLDTWHAWGIDHDHSCCPGEYTCGECVRGILCHGCNKGLGCFKDDAARLLKAVDYLAQYEKARVG